jgi:hypothetical protein
MLFFLARGQSFAYHSASHVRDHERRRHTAPLLAALVRLRFVSFVSLDPQGAWFVSNSGIRT